MTVLMTLLHLYGRLVGRQPAPGGSPAFRRVYR